MFVLSDLANCANALSPKDLDTIFDESVRCKTRTDLLKDEGRKRGSSVDAMDTVLYLKVRWCRSKSHRLPGQINHKRWALYKFDRRCDPSC